jgi:hypothetical protein
MFGDGAVLINQIAAGFTGIPVVERMTSLDTVLTTSSLERGAGVGFGVRLSRRMTPRLRVELALDSASDSLEFSTAANTAIEATRSSFERVWNGIIATGGGVLFTSPNVKATVTKTDGSNRVTIVTGGIEYQLSRNKRAVPYVSGAFGIASHSGSLPELTINGTYGFLFSTAPFAEQDRVRVRFEGGGASAVGSLGAGFRYFMNATRGVRAELRIQFAGNSVKTLVDATPSSTPGSPAFSIWSSTNPSIVFSNTSAVRGNLSAPAISGLTTFTGSGAAVRTALSVGYFMRF